MDTRGWTYWLLWLHDLSSFASYSSKFPLEHLKIKWADNNDVYWTGWCPRQCLFTFWWSYDLGPFDGWILQYPSVFHNTKKFKKAKQNFTWTHWHTVKSFILHLYRQKYGHQSSLLTSPKTSTAMYCIKTISIFCPLLSLFWPLPPACLCFGCAIPHPLSKRSLLMLQSMWKAWKMSKIRTQECNMTIGHIGHG